MDIVTNLMNFVVAHWDKIALIALILSNVLKGIQDAIDTTPGNDINWIEKALTISRKVLGYILGFRPKAPTA